MPNKALYKAMTDRQLLAEWDLILLSICRQCRLPCDAGCLGWDFRHKGPAHPLDPEQIPQILAERALIAKSMALRCRWRPHGQCLWHCLGTAVCNLNGLTLVDEQGEPVGYRRKPKGKDHDPA